ncbi:ABC transporter ATP-binding protein [Nitriliruptoraceae bacterium ZYF776]|nr:ABC transporter ATP-binding protein [Profundirhabdus halotolerans]
MSTYNAMPNPVLEVCGLSRRFGAVYATEDVDLTVMRGERHAVIGPNGAGKTTLFNLIAGRLLPDSGAITLNGREITYDPQDRRNRLGMATTFQHSFVFEGLSAARNVALAVQRAIGVAHRLRWGAAQRRVDDRVDELLASAGLATHGDVLASELSHGHRRSLEVALALATDPSVLLLDEPLAGMSPDEIQRFLAMINELEDVTVLVIEHNIEAVLAMATTITVLDAGRVLAVGDPDTITRSTEVQSAYLGVGHAEELFHA